MAANSQNSRTRTQQNPPNQFLRHNKVTPSGQETIGWDIAGGLLHFAARMAAEGFSVFEHSHDGHHSEVIHGDHHSAHQGKTKDTTGHEDDRVQGGLGKQNNSEHTSGGGDSTHARDGSQQHASSSSSKNYTKGDGHHHMQGDQAFTVEEGGVHYNVAQDFSITATGNGIHINPSNELSMIVGGNEGHVVAGKVSYNSGDDITIVSGTSITLQVGSSSIVITPSGITIQASRVDINP